MTQDTYNFTIKAQVTLDHEHANGDVENVDSGWVALWDKIAKTTVVDQGVTFSVRLVHIRDDTSYDVP